MDPVWFYALAGGALIGLAASLLLVFAQKTAGISGILAGALSLQATRSERTWRWLFVVGLLLGGMMMRFVARGTFGNTLRGWPWLLAAGLLVGYGTRLSGGCTSGHGVCGLSRLSARSLVATVTFIFAGVATVWLVGPGGTP